MANPRETFYQGIQTRNNRLTDVPSPQLSLAVLWGFPIKLGQEENNAAFSRVEFILSWEEGLGLNKTSASSDVASREATHSYCQLCVQSCLVIHTQCRGCSPSLGLRGTGC